jgi:glycosyltransferase involved in cell wall biosynthesis
MKIGFVTRDFRSTFGGAEVFNVALHYALIGIGEEVITYQYNKSKSLLFERMQLYKNVMLGKEKKLLVSHSGLLDLLAVVAYKLAGKDVTVISHVGPGYRHLDNFITLFICRIIISFFCTNHIVLTEKQRLHFNLKKSVIGKTIIRDDFFKAKDNAENEFDSSKCDYILYYGRISKDKGIYDLIEAYSNSNVSFRLVLVGPIEGEKQVVVDFIKKFGMINKIDIVEPVRDVNRMIELIDQSKFVVYPSHYDLYPLVIFEVFLRNKLCLSTYVGENEKIYSNHEMLFKSGDVIELTDKLKFFGENISSFQNDIDNMAEKFSSLTPKNCAQFVRTIIDGNAKYNYE